MFNGYDLSVLVVEDDVDLRHTFTQTLESLGCEVFAAEDGLAALKILKEHRISVVLSDVRMPKMDGVSLLSAMQKNGIETPVVVITGHADYSDHDIDELGGVMMLQKPVRQSQLREILEIVSSNERATG